MSIQRNQGYIEPVYAHIPTEVFNRRPWLGVALGAAGLTLSLCGIAYLGGQIHRYGKTPTQVESDSAKPTSVDSDDGDWVRLAGSMNVICESKIQTENPFEQRLIFGRVDRTYYLAWSTGKQRLFVLELKGEADCVMAGAREKVGVLSAPSRFVLETYQYYGWKFDRLRVPVVALCLGCGPEDAWHLLYGMVAIGATAIFLILNFLGKAKKRREARDRISYLNPQNS